MWVKICGMTTPAAVAAALEAGADAIGFVFAASVRRVTPQAANELATAARGRVPCVAVIRQATQQEFDRILADVPCSGTGTLARNPEIKWTLKLEDLSDLQSRQVAILQSALAQLAVGGRLVYSTCSLETEENEAVVEANCLGAANCKVVNIKPELEQLRRADELCLEDIASLAAGPYLRTIPGVHPCDGFFAAMIERK